MDQEQWEQQSRPRAGSVKRARERAAMGGDSPQKGQSPPRNAGSNVPMNRIRPPMPTGSRDGQGLAGIAISRPIQAPQWPLGGAVDGGPYQTDDSQFQQPQVRRPDPRSNPDYSPPKNRGPAPKRPPRPSQVPQMPDDQPQFMFAQAQRYPPEMLSPTSPMTISSGQSIISSVGSIPDFPTPAPPPIPPIPARKSTHLGPPPSSRRGVSSYYSQAGFVSPIPEESPRPSHQSYASSAAIPSSWGSRSPQYDYSDYEDEDVQDYSSIHNGTIDEVRGESRGSNGDDSDDRGLIRSASFGRRAKPSMIVTRNSSTASIEKVRPLVRPQQHIPHESDGSSDIPIGLGLAPPNMSAGQRDTVWPTVDSDPLASGTGLIDASNSSSETVPTIGTAVTINEPAPVHTRQPSAPKTNEMLGAYKQASGLSPGSILPLRQPSPLRQASPGFSGLSAIRRPPRLNIDAVREAEARGSLTSLPDLIARATRLASMMDRGRRPGSRMAVDDWGSMDKEMGMGVLRDEKHKSGLSGMLAAFPPPGLATPRDGTPTRPNSSWPSGYGPSSPNNDEKRAPRGRRCCGLPLWGFFVVCLILLIIIAAAIVVPLEFLVFNKKSTTSTTSLTAVQKCEASSTSQCQNGGTSIVTSGACSCICTNGFTGSTCTTANATGCATTSLEGVSGNVTLGDAIARLVEGAGNFSVPLDAQTVIARFNAEDLSCATENALVTFDGESGRVGGAADVVSDPAAATPTTSSKARKHKHRRQEASSTFSTSAVAATASSGIVYDSSSPPATTSSSATASSTATVDPSANFVVTEEVLDFVRVAVLYVLQESTLDAAVSVQGTLQKIFDLQSYTNGNVQNLTLGAGVWVDLLGFRVDAGAGDGVVGGMNASVVVKRESRSGGVRGRSVELWHV